MVPVKTSNDFKTMNITRLHLSTAIAASLDFVLTPPGILTSTRMTTREKAALKQLKKKS